MPVRFQRRVRIARGISINLNKNSVSTTLGRRGYHVTVGPKGTRTTVGIPGSGLSSTSYQRGNPSLFLILAIVVVILLGFLLHL